jgi:uncharacterized LabA/DUF88 family protein
MMFVDGENFAIRGQTFVAESGANLPKRLFKPGVFLWVPGLVPEIMSLYLLDSDVRFPRKAERSFYYTSVVADDRGVLAVRLTLRRNGFTPMVFKKIRKDQKAKGVDIALTKDMLMEAVRDHYDIAVLLAGDGDYVPVVDEIQRLGKQVIVAFWDGDWVSEELRWRADHFVDLTDGLKTALNNCREKGWTD